MRGFFILSNGNNDFVVDENGQNNMEKFSRCYLSRCRISFLSYRGVDKMMNLLDQILDQIIQMVRSILKRRPISNYQTLYYLQTANLKTSDFVLLDDHQKMN